MRKETSLSVLVIALLLPGSLPAREPGFREFGAVQESLSRVHPRLRSRWLDRRGVVLPGENAPLPAATDSGGLRLVGKWGRGPSVEVTGRDTLVALTLGSEVALLNFADPDSPVVLSEIQLDIIPRQSALYGSFLVTTNRAIEFWDITDPRAPVRRSSIPYTVGDFAIADSFLFFVCGDTFHAYSIGDPTNPRLLGRCLEGGYVVAATRNVAVVRTDVVDLIDVSDPAHPRLAGGIGIDALGTDVRGNLMCVTKWWNGLDEDDLWLDLVDISDPANPRVLSELDDVGGFDIHIDGPFAFVSGFYYGIWQFAIVDIQDSTQPSLVSTCGTPGWNNGVWADWTSDWAYVADDFGGLAVIDIRNLNAPRVDTSCLSADMAIDVYIGVGRAYVADYRSSLQILDVSNPTAPTFLGSYRSGDVRSAAARDSVAYVSWPRPRMLAVDVSDPARPESVGACEGMFAYPEDMVLRDSFVYIAEASRFQVVNVARPRSPVLVGSCNVDGVAVVVQDTFAYTAAGATCIINIARPDSPYVVGRVWNRSASGIAVRDTFLYLPYVYDTLYVYSTANPAQPRRLSATPAGVWPGDVVLGRSTAYVGATYGIDAYDLSDPARPRRVGGAAVPHEVRRLCYSNGLLYAACWEAGVAVYETTQVGVAEEPERRQVEPGLRAGPSPTRGKLWVETGARTATGVSVWDVAGRRALARTLDRLTTGPLSLDLSHLPPGIYFVKEEGLRERGNRGPGVEKVVLAR